MNYSKKRKLRYLKKFLNNIENKNNNFPEGYLESKQNRINCIKWLIAYYEGRAACKPKELLEATLHSYNGVNPEDIFRTYDYVLILYYWIYHNEIVGF